MNTFKYFSISVFVFSLFFPLRIMGNNNITAKEIVNNVDKNMVANSIQHRSKMIIHQSRRIDEKEMLSFALSIDTSFAIFLNPSRDRDTKYLKLGDNLWMYLPSVEKVIKIAGHMLRQSMMGSDFSYEDTLEYSKLITHYEPEIIGEEVIDGRECYILQLTAIRHDVTYYMRKIWVDKERFIVLKSELYAKSGKLLKLMTVLKVEKYGDRFYPTHVVMENKLRKDTKTEMVTSDIKFNVAIPEELFSIRNLNRNIKFLESFFY